MEHVLQMIMDKQEQFQHEKMGDRVDEVGSQEAANQVESHSKFAMEEIFEMLRELPFHKPWKDYSDLDQEDFDFMFNEARKEFIDAFIFLINAGLYLGFDETLLLQMYLEKLGINNKRQEDPELGYVTT